MFKYETSFERWLKVQIFNPEIKHQKPETLDYEYIWIKMSEMVTVKEVEVHTYCGLNPGTVKFCKVNMRDGQELCLNVTAKELFEKLKQETEDDG